MLTLSVGTPDELERALEPAVDLLLRGGVVAFPTDTLYGLAVNPRDHDAVARLFDLKGRPAGSPIPLVAADVAQAAQTGEMTEIGRRLAGRFWPGPLTLVIRAGPAIDELIHQGLGTIGIRVPAHPVARALARGAQRAVTATSANPSGQPAAVTADEVRAAFGDRLDVVVDAGPARGGAPSTIVDVTTDPPRLVRAGAVPWERVLEFLQSARDA